MKDTQSVKKDIVFTTKDKGGQEIRLSGLSNDVLSRPEQIKKVMELLNLPEGAVARIMHTTEDVIIR
ncbi:hypothetical protein [Chitinimonas sp. BJB300]|uniref:hypothetical protein n=1 Tax=Chitinimonas sp. BJB300 TaxID=1559339 RepID=UPI000C0E666A|nr:hypothetical protein [Chitinimonas sp. BJB300]PHV09753.1 hypothetical protein CSQ89_19955 [Chitinimonas sp. BJB300]TSJ90144.1 hypothetical protein FG002_008185 [Chitinimonas sp. BJB300]